MHELNTALVYDSLDMYQLIEWDSQYSLVKYRIV